MENRVQTSFPGTQTILNLSPAIVNHRAWGATDLVVLEHAVSAVLFQVRDAEQAPVYYMSKTLLSAETRYLPLEKLVLAMLMALRKLSHYFENHSIIV